MRRQLDNVHRRNSFSDEDIALQRLHYWIEEPRGQPSAGDKRMAQVEDTGLDKNVGRAVRATQEHGFAQGEGQLDDTKGESHCD